MKMLQIFFKKNKQLVTTSIEEIIANCPEPVTEFEVMKFLKEKVRRNQIELIKHRAN